MAAELSAEKSDPSYLQDSSVLCQVVSLLRSRSGECACPHVELGRPLRHREGASGDAGWAFYNTYFWATMEIV